ncbi:MAG: hypothetical protein LBS72_03045 [Oscillospiraceae bacterium]|nr:hypothetical protein [Oscillospiraceae bacterium]
MYYAERRGLSRKTRDALVLVILLLLLCLVVMGLLYLRAAARDKQVNEMLIGQGSAELDEAFQSVVRLSRVGGSYTTMQIGELRQHLYAVRRLNSIASTLYGKASVVTADAQITRALDYVTACESRLMQGQAIDEQLQELRGLLETLSEQDGI